MENSISSDFYQGWLIEVTPAANGFQSTCYSPSRERLQDYTAHRCQSDAFKSAKLQIRNRTARYALANVMRDLYETGSLEFEEWRSLNHSLVITAVVL